MGIPICDRIFVVCCLIFYVSGTCSILIVGLCLLFMDLPNFLGQFCMMMAFALVGSIATQVVSFVRLRNSGQFNSPGKNIAATLHFLQLSIPRKSMCILFAKTLDSEELIKAEIETLILLQTVNGHLAFAPSALIYGYLSAWALLGQQLSVPPKLVWTGFISSTLHWAWIFSCWGKYRFPCSETESKLVLSWPSIVSQFFWRSGTLISRTLAFAAYASAFGFFLFIPIASHWVLVILVLLLLRPSGTYIAQSCSGWRSWGSNSVSSVLLIFDWLEPEAGGWRLRLAFYALFLAENTLLTLLWFFRSSTNLSSSHLPLLLSIGLSMLWGLSWLLFHFTCCRLEDNPAPSRRARLSSSQSAFQCGIPYQRKKPTNFDVSKAIKLDLVNQIGVADEAYVGTGFSRQPTVSPRTSAERNRVNRSTSSLEETSF